MELGKTAGSQVKSSQVEKRKDHENIIFDLTDHFVRYFFYKLSSYYKCKEGKELKPSGTEQGYNDIADLTASGLSVFNTSADVGKPFAREWAKSKRRKKATSVLLAFGRLTKYFSEPVLGNLLIDILIHFFDIFGAQLRLLHKDEYRISVSNIAEDLVDRLMRGIHEAQASNSDKLLINYIGLLCSRQIRDEYSEKIAKFMLIGKSKLQTKQQFWPTRGFKLKAIFNGESVEWNTSNLITGTSIFKSKEEFCQLVGNPKPQYQPKYGWRLPIQWEDLNDTSVYCSSPFPAEPGLLKDFAKRRMLSLEETKEIRRRVTQELDWGTRLIKVPAPSYPYHIRLDLSIFIRTLRRNKGCIISGPSGSGKTEFLHHFIRYTAVQNSLFQFVISINAHKSHFPYSTILAAEKIGLNTAGMSGNEVLEKIVLFLKETKKECCITLDNVNQNRIEDFWKIGKHCSKIHFIILCTTDETLSEDSPFPIFETTGILNTDLSNLYKLYFPSSTYKAVREPFEAINAKVAGNSYEVLGILAAIHHSSHKEIEVIYELKQYKEMIQNCESMQEIFERRLDFIQDKELLTERAEKLLMFFAYLDTDKLSMNVFDVEVVRKEVNTLTVLRFIHSNNEGKVRIPANTQDMIKSHVSRRRCLECRKNIMKDNLKRVDRSRRAIKLGNKHDVTDVDKKAILRNEKKFRYALAELNSN